MAIVTNVGGSNVQDVNAAGQAQVNTGTLASSGMVKVVSNVDSGSITGTAVNRELELTDDFRLRVGIDNLLLSEQFPGSALNSALWTAPVTTMTVAVTGGLLRLNSALSTASGAVARVQSYRSFPIFGTYPSYTEFLGQFATTPQTNNVCEWGLGIATGTTAPTDGVFFRLNATGEFRCVVNFNGTENQSNALTFNTLIGAGVTRHFAIGITEDGAEFWIDEVLVAKVNRPTAAAGITATNNLPVLMRNYNSAVPAIAQIMSVGLVACSIGDMNAQRPWAQVMAGMGGMGSQGQTGGTMGSTANYVNNTNPTAAVPTNTTAALGSGLGGQFWATATLAVNTDGIISSYQVPLGTSSAPGKSLVITGIKIESFVQTALTGGGFQMQWCLAYGHNAVSLATTETATSKAPRRVPLGTQPMAAAAAVLTTPTPVAMPFNSPITVQPGEFVQTVVKYIGNVATAGVISHLITYDCHWE
jgi:hypothetical protein